ncbi:MAG: helix-turn-helix transcriptional regulator [Rhodocyclaceae bacterium]|nr:helix-turn-helix transcriptional regulator [Rhodocyclaceae bacterium]MCA3077123.1 helix-turn-helix transcriptional regulator [Rhodocyclaceae bacterium]MCA3099942.1 helix-turn-helix transcriptional regulator [Rhodocyclaceae bacterium]MCA3101023.1 helix-turn-helix transcriptional regulator [Rhodocyclaceae bacterium]MCA3108286.1 helix-turn-helix transcriptional regulator [Rhodocyclaceae bacterium]
MPSPIPSVPSSVDLGQRLSEVLNAISLRVLLLDARATLLYANLAGHASLEAGGGLDLRSGQVRAASSAQQACFEQALAGAVRGMRSLVELGDAADGRLYAIIPLVGEFEGAEPMVVLLSGHFEPLEPIVLTLFAKAFGLTPSEREVLVALCDGLLPQDIADQRSVSLHTIRTQIGAIRGKVGVRTITHVVRKASTLPPMSALQARIRDLAPEAGVGPAIPNTERSAEKGAGLARPDSALAW